MKKSQIASILKEGGVAVIPTDTLYGLVARADTQSSVQRIYSIKGRTPTKPLIILISSLQDVERFFIQLSDSQKNICEKLWPGKVSIILPCVQEQFAYLHRGTNSLAFRMPKARWLRQLIAQTGPLVAPSANPEGLEPAKTIKEARAYFGDKVDGYYSRLFPRLGKPSTLVELRNEKVVVLRQGAGKIPQDLLA